MTTYLDPSWASTYWCYDGDELLYVGQCRQPHLRMGQHRSRKTPWIDRVTRVETLLFYTRVDALLMERKATHRDQPLYPSDVDGAPAKASSIASLAADIRMFYGLDRTTSRLHATRTLEASGYFDGASEPSMAGLTADEAEVVSLERMRVALDRVAAVLT